MDSKRFDLLVKQAQNNYQQGQIEEALCLCLLAIKILVTPELLIDIALLYDELNDYELAKSYYTKALELDPMEARAYYGLGTVYEALNQVDEAIAHYNEAININDHYTAAHFFVANIYDDLKQTPLAIHHYQRVIDLEPEHFYAHLNLGSIYEIKGENNLALTYFLKAESLNHKNHLVYFNLGVVYRKLGQIDACVRCYLKSISISTQYSFAYLNLAIVYKDDLNDLEQAIKIYTDGINQHEEEAVLYFNRGCAYALLKCYEEAVKDLTEAIRFNSNLKSYMASDNELDLLRETEIFKKTFYL